MTDINMLLMAEKGIRGGICHAIQRYARANNKYMIKTKNRHIFNILDANNLHGWVMSQKLPLDSFKWKKYY